MEQTRLRLGEQGSLAGRCSEEAPSCNTVLPPPWTWSSAKERCWSAAASGSGRKAYSAGNVNVRRWGMSADL